MTDSNQPGLFDPTPPDGDGDANAAITLARYAEQAYLDYAVSVAVSYTHLTLPTKA